MKQETLLEVLNKKKKGQFIRLSYRSDLDKQVKAAAKALYSVDKVSVGTFKYGCDLRRVKRYQEREAARTTPKREVVEWARWLVPSVLNMRSFFLTTTNSICMMFLKWNGE